MTKEHGKYMVNLIGEDFWNGEYFDTQEQAIEEGKRVLIENDLDSEVFGEYLGNLTHMGEGKEPLKPTNFLVGKVRGLPIPDDLGETIIDGLDESDWWELTSEGDRPSQHIFSEKDVQEFNELLVKWLEPRVGSSGYYLVDVLGEVSVLEGDK